MKQVPYGLRWVMHPPLGLNVTETYPHHSRGGDVALRVNIPGCEHGLLA